MTHEDPPLIAPAPDRLLGGQAPGAFLAKHWQIAPKLIRQAWPGFACPITAAELAGLACESGVDSRLVIRRGKRWQVRQGPLAHDDFAGLPTRNWTLLVQAVDAFVDAVAAIGPAFDFLPAWRRDDVMISYAAPGGGVGAHVDAYDVFLLQGAGRRRWRWGGPVGPDVPGAPLRLMDGFRPCEEAVLEPGDMLYLPPGVPHEGTGLDDGRGEGCLTLSIGFRAPSAGDLLAVLADSLLAGDDPPLPDAARKPARDPTTLSPDDIALVRHALAGRLADDRALALALGRAVTEPRQAPEPPMRVPRAATIARRLRNGAVLERDGFTRLAHTNVSGQSWLFVNGEAHACARDLAGLLASRARLTGADLAAWLDRDEALDLIRSALLASGAARLVGGGQRSG
jgi:50S ribosomal protein L16 3-hydroxylase